jgi:hypothetical protein
MERLKEVASTIDAGVVSSYSPQDRPTPVRNTSHQRFKVCVLKCALIAYLDCDKLLQSP